MRAGMTGSNRHGYAIPLLSVLLVLIGMAVSPAFAADRPNIIFIYTDDQAPGFTGFEGHPLVQTPHLDRLAAESVYFTRCYVPTPQCAPSRATVLTGQYPHTHGVVTNGSDQEPMMLEPHAVTFAQELREAGYACGIVGKWHLPYATAAEPGFGLVDYVATDLNSGGDKWQWENCPVAVNGQKQKADKFLIDWHGDRAIDFLDDFHEKPFFLWLCFRAPHAPLVYPPGTESLYPPDVVDLPENMQQSLSGYPPVLRSSPPVTAFNQKARNKQALREARSKYYAMITQIDTNVGRVLEHMEKLGLRDNTMIVFASDNGWCLGEHGLYSKGPFFYDELVRVPLLIRHPKLGKPGTKTDRIVGLVDLAPTFCEVAGLKVPIIMQGDSLTPVLRDPDTRRHPDEEFFEYASQKGKDYPARGVVTEHYKLIQYFPNQFVLYDLRRDPGETQNVMTVPEYSAVAKTLQNRLEVWRKRTKDPTHSSR